MRVVNSEIKIYECDGMVSIETPGGVCLIAPQVAIEMTVSLMRAALRADPSMDVDTITDAYIVTRGAQ